MEGQIETEINVEKNNLNKLELERDANPNKVKPEEGVNSGNKYFFIFKYS